MPTRLRDVLRRLRQRLEREAARQQQSSGDPGLQEIADWGAWFITAHTQRLEDLNLPPAQHAHELATVTAQAAITQRMRDDYLARTTTP